MRRVFQVLLVLLILADLGASLRHDLALNCWRQGSERLRERDNAGALALLRRAERGAPGSRPIAYDTGVALYRLGDLTRARERFAAASQAADPLLRTAALYNLGNCAFRQGEVAAGRKEKTAGKEEKAAGDQGGTENRRGDAQRLFQEAARHYEQVLVFAPGAADARHNLGVVRSRLAGLASTARSAERSSEGERAGGERGAEGAGKGAGKGAGRDGKEGKEGRGGEASAGRRAPDGKGTSGRSPGDGSRGAVPPGKAEPQLSREASELLLNEARGREAGSAFLPAKGERGRQVRPDKDW